MQNTNQTKAMEEDKFYLVLETSSLETLKALRIIVESLFKTGKVNYYDQPKRLEQRRKNPDYDENDYEEYTPLPSDVKKSICDRETLVYY